MTEGEWLGSEDPAAMLDFLARCNGAPVGHKVVPERAPSDRKLRLFACACCRQVSPAVGPDLSSLRSAEAFADGLTTDTARHIAWNHAVNSAASHAFRHLCAHTMNHEFQLRRALAAWDGDQAEGRRVFADILRDIAGNPHRPVTLRPSPGRSGRSAGFWAGAEGCALAASNCSKLASH